MSDRDEVCIASEKVVVDSHRFFGVVDLVINSAAGLLTLTLIGFVLEEENYPGGPQCSEI